MRRLVNAVSIIIIFSYLLFSMTPITFADNPQQIAEDTFPSVALLMLEDENRQPLSLASGFFVKEDI
ncbi:MAG: hypothetical protein ACOCQA_03805, partial [bacterium]